MSKVVEISSEKGKNWKKLDSINWDFKGTETQYLTHKYHSYPARFIPQIPKWFIKLFTKRGDIVADPMCGCGTTLTEAVLAGRDAIGVDLSPLACLISEVKTTSILPKQLKRLNGLVKKMRSIIDEKREVKTLNYFTLEEPNRKIGEKFTDEIKNELAIIKAYLDTIKDKKLRKFSYVAFSAVIRRILRGKKVEKKPYEIFKWKIKSMTKIMKKFNSKRDPKSQSIVYKADARKLPISSNKVNLIVMSPPYVNALDYYREHQYNMMWLGMDYKKFSKGEMGGHSHFISNRWRLLSEYLGDMFRSIAEMKRILRRGGICSIVIGNSTIEYEVIESYKYFLDISKQINFPCKRVYHRKIDPASKYTSQPIGNINDEFICVFKKEDNDLKVKVNRKIIENFVKEKHSAMKKRIRKHSGTAAKNEVSKKRLRENLNRIDEAYNKVSKDISL